MKSLLLFFCLQIIFSLYAEDQFSFFYGVSSSSGINSGFRQSNQIFSSLLDINFLNETLFIERGYFKSEYISLGPVTFSGIHKKHQNLLTSLFTYNDTPEISIYEQGNPLSNCGVIFTIPRLNSGISGFSKNEDSQIYFWKNFNYRENEISLVQSFTFPHKPVPDDSWYFDEYKIQSTINGNSSLSFISGNENLWGGGILSLAFSPEDQPGVSLHGMSGFSYSKMLFQTELILNSEYYRPADLTLNQYPLICKGEISAEWDVFKLSSYILFLWGREPYLGEFRDWSILSESEFNINNNIWDFKGSLNFSFYNEKTMDLFLKYTIKAAVERSLKYFTFVLEGQAEYDKIFTYFVSFHGEYENPLFALKYIPEIVIDRKIIMNNLLSVKIKMKQFKFSFSFSLKDIPLYNSDTVDMKAEFFAGLEFFTKQLK